MRLSAFVLAVASLLVAVPAAAVDRVVDDNGVACLSGRPLHATISSAVAAAAPGETILVCPGTYTENVIVNKADLTVRAQGRVRLQPADPFFYGFDIRADGVTIQGFEISGYTNSSGVLVRSGNRADIRDNRVHDNDLGIFVAAGSQHRVRYNVAEKNNEGIRVQDASADVTNNTVKNNSDGIRPISCDGAVTVDHNQMIGNEIGILATVCDGVIISNNTVQGRGAFGAGIIVRDLLDALVKLNQVQDAGFGIAIQGTGGATATFNTVSGNAVGVDVVTSDGATVTRNNVSRSFAVDCQWDGAGTNVFTKNNCGTQVPPGAFD